MRRKRNKLNKSIIMVDKVFEAIEKVLGVTRRDTLRSDADRLDIYCVTFYGNKGLVEREIGLEVCKDTSSVHYALVTMINLKDKSKIEKVNLRKII